MQEKSELIQKNGASKSYGSVPKYIDTEDDESERPVRCLCTKRDCILVGILSVLVAAAIITSLAIGIPSIQKKQRLFNEMGSPDISSYPPRLLDSTPNPLTTYSSWLPTVLPPLTPVNQSLATSNVTTVTTPFTRRNGTEGPSNAPRLFKRAAVSADDARCAEAGRAILQANGSALDAAVSTLLCIEAVHPQHSGIGGGFFMLYYSRKENKTYAIDARETAPAKSTNDMFSKNRTLSNLGGMAVAVPGTVRGYWDAHQKFGRLPWKQLFQSTISMCREGYKIDNSLARALQKRKEYILQQDSLREIFVDKETGDVFQENDTLIRPGLAATYETIANLGAKEFYEGQMAKQLVNDIQAAGGIISLDDLRNYSVLMKEPLLVGISDNIKLHTIPPPSSGVLLAFIMNVMKGYDYNEASESDPQTFIPFLQHLVESFKFSFAFKSRLGDDNFVDVSQIVKNLTSESLAAHIRSLIRDNATFDPSYYMAEALTPSDHGTSHVNVVSPEGDIVSVTSTINHGFGAKLRSRSLDIILNDEMDDFSVPVTNDVSGLPASTANFIAPGKRPISSMVPSIFFDASGEPVLTIGGAGGTAILTSMANVVVRHFFLNYCVPNSISSPRLHHQLEPNVLEMEPEFSIMYIQALEKIGHNVTFSPPETHINAIMRYTNGSLLAVADHRIGCGVNGF